MTNSIEIYEPVAVYSMLCNRNSGRCYDILILHKDISWENQQKLLVLAAEAEGVTIRLLSVAAWGGRLPEEAGYLLYGGSGVPPAFAGRHFFKVSAYIISGLQSYCERRCKPAV